MHVSLESARVRLQLPRVTGLHQKSDTILIYPPQTRARIERDRILPRPFEALDLHQHHKNEGCVTRTHATPGDMLVAPAGIFDRPTLDRGTRTEAVQISQVRVYYVLRPILASLELGSSFRTLLLLPPSSTHARCVFFLAHTCFPFT